MAKGKYKNKRKKHNVDRWVEEAATPNDLPINKEETKEQEHVVKVLLNGEPVFLHEKATMLEFLKVVKERTEQAVSVTKMIETEIEL